MLQPGADSCELCRRETNPEGLYRLAVAYFESALRVCGECRADFEAGGRRVAPFEPALAETPRFRWPGPLAEDALAALRAARTDLAAAGEPLPPADRAEARAQVGRWRGGAAYTGEGAFATALATAAIAGEELGPLEEVERAALRLARADGTSLLLGIYAHRAAADGGLDEAAPAGRKPSRATEALLDVASREYVSAASYAPRTELDGRVLALSLALRIERGRWDDAERAIRQFLATPTIAPVARDPRIHLFDALLAARTSNLEALDRALVRTIDACDRAGPPALAADWAGVKAIALYDQYVRAVQASSWPRARDALRAYVRLAPRDRGARYDLGYAYIRCSLDAVAREVLESALDEEAQALIRAHFDEDPRDRRARVLYCASLVRLGETGKAWVLLRDALEREAEDLLRAEECHLAGICARAGGELDRAAELLAEARAIEARHDRRDRRTQKDLACVLHDQLRARLDELCADRFAGLLAFLERHGETLQDELTPVGVELLLGFVASEASRRFAPVPGFAPDPIDRARFSHVYALQAQAYIFLAKRRLHDAVRCDREARAAGASPIPIALLLRFLERYRAGFEGAPFRFVAE